MNRKQLVIMWLGVGIVFFVAFVTDLDARRPEYALFVFRTFLTLLVTVGLMITFKSKQLEMNRSKKVNLRKGYRRLVSVLSLTVVLVGTAVFVAGLSNDAEDALIPGILIALFGFSIIWIIYWVLLYIIKGFNTRHCENCEREIGKIEELFKFGEYSVCGDCNKKLTGNKDDGAS